VLLAVACTSAPASTATPTGSAAPTLAPPIPTLSALPAAPTSTPTVPPSLPGATATVIAPPPSPTPSGYPAGSVIVTFKVGPEQYRVLVIDPANVAIAQKLLAGDEAPRIPNGLVVRGDPSVNIGWSWHIDPASLEFADMTTEVCDGRPSYVEDGTLTGDYFCPWNAKVIAVEPANP